MKMIVSLLSIALVATGCASTLNKIDAVGKPPAMSRLSDPTIKQGYQPVTWPLPKEVPPGVKSANSLWQPGARAFFRDQRAAKEGDILRVKIKIKDKAELTNQTQRTRSNTESLAAPEVFGLQSKIVKPLLPGTADPTNLLDLTGNLDQQGDGTMKRDETIETSVAVTVTQVLPNGNLVVDGKQEIRINFEIREIAVSGVIRPQDINSDNTIDSSQIAEARIIYGGRGQITDVQQPRWGNQVIDALSPF